MPMWLLGQRKTTRTLQLCGGSERKQQNKRFTLLGAQFVRISLTSRTTWQNTCLLSSSLLPLPFSPPLQTLLSNGWLSFSSFFRFLFFFFSIQVGSVYHFVWKICFSCEYNKCSDWSCSMKTAVCLMEEGTVVMGGVSPYLSTDEPHSNSSFQMKTKMLPLPWYCSGH